MRTGPDDWGYGLSADQHLEFGRQAMTALAGLHRIDVAKVPYLGAPVPFAEDVTRWDRFRESGRTTATGRCAEGRQRLLDTMPADAPIGIFHGDFQTANLRLQGCKLLALIDFELTGIGATLNDVGRICTFSDRDAGIANRHAPCF